LFLVGPQARWLLSATIWPHYEGEGREGDRKEMEVGEKREKLELLIQGGKVLDPISGLRGQFDLGIRSGRIACIEKDVPPSRAREVLKLDGDWIFPGLVDFHCHVFWPGTMVSVEPEGLARSSGVLTLIDGGSAGACNFLSFRRSVIEPSPFHILAFLNLSCIGLATEGIPGLNLKELDHLPLAHVPSALRTIEENRDLIVGIKVRAYHGLPSLAPLRLARQLADQTNLPLMVHLAPSPPSLGQILPFLREGDILTHIFHPQPGSLLDGKGKVRPEFGEARQRGIWMDVGLARVHTDFSIVRGAIEEGFLPDIISTDLSSGNREGMVVDLPTTLSKFLAFGLELEEVLPMVTRTPLAVAGGGDRIKGIAVGKSADLSIFRWEEGPVSFHDHYGNSVEGKGRLSLSCFLLQGRRVDAPSPT
jgi:dihydroorotase